MKPNLIEYRACRNQSGFSLIELLVVMSIGLILAAMAIPIMSTTMDDYQVRNAMGSTANLTQQCRTVAIQQDLTQRLHYVVDNGRVVLFIKPASVTATAPGTTFNPATNTTSPDPQYWLPGQFSIPGAPSGSGAPTPMTTLAMWGSSSVPVVVNGDAYFNSRGLPCTTNAVTGVCNVTSGFVYYFQYQSHGVTRWMASSISPAGRIQSWYWTGGSWGN